MSKVWVGKKATHTHKGERGQRALNSRKYKDQHVSSNLNLPWFTNSQAWLELPTPEGVSRAWIDMLIDDKLPCDCIALLSMSQALVVQKSLELLGMLLVWCWLILLFDRSSKDFIESGLKQHAKQPLLCYETFSIRNQSHSANITAKKRSHKRKVTKNSMYNLS